MVVKAKTSKSAVSDSLKKSTESEVLLSELSDLGATAKGFSRSRGLAFSSSRQKRQLGDEVVLSGIAALDDDAYKDFADRLVTLRERLSKATE